MSEQLFPRNRMRPLLGSAVTAVWVVLACALPSYGQVSPEEHAKHHPGGTSSASAPPAGRGLGEMSGMMEGTTGDGTAQRSLFPSLMNMREFNPEQRQQVHQQANDRMREGLSLLSRGLEQLADAAQSDDLPAMQAAAEQMRMGLARLESGAFVERALAEGNG